MPDHIARKLRKAPTDAEIHLWWALRDRRLRGYKFRRQHPVGPYVADFACTREKLIVEVHGGQHAANEHDAERTEWLESQGWRVLRFWNNDVLTNIEGVVETILAALGGG
jgi:very-short-patch-repair endonuclease